MTAIALQRLVSLGMWGGLSSLFSLFLASGNLFFGGAILAALLLYAAVLVGPQLLAALWLMGAPTVFGFANMFLKALPFVTMERLFFVTLVGMAFLRAAFLKERVSALTRLEILILLFIAYALLSLIVHTTAETWRKDLWFLMQYAIPMGTYLLSRRIDWSGRGARLFLASLTFTGVALAAIGVMQSLFGITLFTVKTVTEGHVERAYGMFSNAHTYIATLVIFLIVTLFQVNLYRDALARAVLVAAMLAILVGVVLGETRAPWGGAALALLVIFLRDREVRPLLLLGGLIGAAAGAILLTMMLDDLGTFLDRLRNLNTLAGRLAVWATALNMMAHHPLFGVGFGVGAFLANKAEYITGVGPLTAHYAIYLEVPHNEYLHVGVLLGLTGLIAFLAIVLGVVRQMFRIHRDAGGSPTSRRLALYAGAIVLGLLFNSLLSDTFLQEYFWTLAFFIAGLAASDHREAMWRQTMAVPGGRIASPA